MSTTAQIVGVITALLSLFLVVRGYQSHGHSMNSTVKMALAWAVIIVAWLVIVRFFAG